MTLDEELDEELKKQGFKEVSMDIKQSRMSQVQYYLGIAKAVSQRATCLRRKFGAVIVNDNTIVGTGYCGSPRGCTDCMERGTCKRDDLNIPHGERYELCYSVHAETNAMLHAGRDRCKGGTMYLYGDMAGYEDRNPVCPMCRKLIINAGIKTVITNSTKEIPDGHIFTVRSWIEKCDILDEDVMNLPERNCHTCKERFTYTQRDSKPCLSCKSNLNYVDNWRPETDRTLCRRHELPMDMYGFCSQCYKEGQMDADEIETAQSGYDNKS